MQLKHYVFKQGRVSGGKRLWHGLARKGILAPQHISLICTDPDPTFRWFSPSIAHIDWDSRKLARRIVGKPLIQHVWERCQAAQALFWIFFCGSGWRRTRSSR